MRSALKIHSTLGHAPLGSSIGKAPTPTSLQAITYGRRHQEERNNLGKLGLEYDLKLGSFHLILRLVEIPAF